MTAEAPIRSNFIRNIVIDDLESGKHETVLTRFPPEPNGHLHIGHAKSICLNFGLAQEFGGATNLRFDDTNPLKESEDFARAIMEDVRWLGFEWKELRHASDYFQQLYDFAEHLVREGKAYVDDLDAEQMRAYRGTLTEPGVESPARDRAVDENLDLFRRMKAGEFEDGAMVLRAKIVETPGRMLQIFEYRHDWREIWLDGRPLPALEDTYPKWNGYSVGRWEGDTFVVESIGFDERSWLDKLGYPHSEEMRLEERYRRLDADTLELRMTVVDPVVYAEPFESDVKQFRLNREKSRRWDEQIYCIPAEEMTYQELIGTGNTIE